MIGRQRNWSVAIFNQLNPRPERIMLKGLLSRNYPALTMAKVSKTMVVQILLIVVPFT